MLWGACGNTAIKMHLSGADYETIKSLRHDKLNYVYRTHILNLFLHSFQYTDMMMILS